MERYTFACYSRFSLSENGLSDNDSILGQDTDEAREQREMRSPYSQDSYGQGYGNPAGGYNAENNQFAPPPGQVYDAPHNAPYSPQSTATYSPRDYNPQDYTGAHADTYSPPARTGVAGESYDPQPGVYDYTSGEYGAGDRTRDRERDRERADQVSPTDVVPPDGERFSSLHSLPTRPQA